MGETASTGFKVAHAASSRLVRGHSIVGKSENAGFKGLKLI
jgi:hypothetical protein